jgi:uncharacterized protein (TIGR02147 family)
MTDLYTFDSYKDYLKDIIVNNKQSRGFQSQLAKAATCQVSYLSQVLNSKTELTPDHGINIAKFLGLNKNDTEYFLCLINYSRATTITLVDYIKKQMSLLKIKSTTLEHKFEVDYKPLSDEAINVMHSSWLYLAVQTALDIPALRTVNALSEKFKVPKEKIEDVLQFSAKHKMVTEKNNEWFQTDAAVDQLSTSKLGHVIHHSWNEKSCSDIEIKNPDSVHTLFISALVEEDYIKIKNIISDSLKRTLPIILDTTKTPDKLYCFKCNFFEVK